MENLHISAHSNVHQESHFLPLNEDIEALLHYGQAHTETQPVRMEDLRCFEPETPADSQVKWMRSMQTSVYPLHLQHGESLQGFDSNTYSIPDGLGRSQNQEFNTHFPTSIHQSDPQEEQPPSASLNSPIVSYCTDINPFHAPHLNPSWPALVPHFNHIASMPCQNPFFPVYTPPLHFNPAFNPNFGPVFNPNFNPAFNPNFEPAFNPNFNPAFNPNFNPAFNPNFNPAFNPNFNPAFNPNFNPAFNPIVACGGSSFPCLVLQPHMSVYPVCPTLFLHPNLQPPEASGPVFNSRISGGRFPADVLDSYHLWQRLCETARGFSSGSPDTEALACFFIRVIRALAARCPDLPFTAAVNAGVEEWRKISLFEREQYHITARMFMELEEQNRADQSIPAQTEGPSGNVKKTRSKRAVQEHPVQDLAKSALMEYTQVMDALESKVSEGSEVAAADEQDMCALYLNQMFNNCEFTTEAGFDMDFISSLLSMDHNLTDDLKENSRDMFSSVIPEPGCSDWTRSTVSDAQILPSFAADVGENGSRNAFQTLSQSSQGVSLQETINSAFQDLMADGNSSAQKDVSELDTTVQSDCFSLQNYNHATFTHTIKHPLTPANGGVEQDGEKNVVVGQNAKKCTHTAQRNNTAKTQANTEEKNLNQNKKQKSQRERRKQQKITALDERTALKSEEKDGRRPKTADTRRKTQDAQRRSETVRETDLIKTIVEREPLQQRTDMTETRRSAMDGRRGNKSRRDGQMRRGHSDGDFEGRLRPIKTGRSHDKRRRATQAERNNGKTCRGAESGRPKKQQKLAIGEKDDGFQIT